MRMQYSNEQDAASVSDSRPWNPENVAPNPSTKPLNKEELRFRRKRLYEALQARDGGIPTGVSYTTGDYSIKDFVGPVGKPVTLSQVAGVTMNAKPNIEYLSPTFTPAEKEFLQDCKPLWTHHYGSLALRQTFTFRYLRAVSRSLRDDLYDYSNPDYDPMYPEPDSKLRKLNDAAADDKTKLMQAKKDAEKVIAERLCTDRSQADKDRERMPPPSALPSEYRQSADVKPVVGAASTSSTTNGHSNGESTDSGSSTPKDEQSDKKFVCNIGDCKKAYKNLQGLKNHIKNNHPGAPIPSRLSHNEEAILATTLGSSPTAPPAKTPASTPLTPVKPAAPPSSKPATPQPYSPYANTPSKAASAASAVSEESATQSASSTYETTTAAPQTVPPIQYVTVSSSTVPSSSNNRTYTQPQAPLPPQQQQARMPAPPQLNKSPQPPTSQPILQSTEQPQFVQAGVSSPQKLMSASSESVTPVAPGVGQPVRRFVPPKTGTPNAAIIAKLRCSYCHKVYKTQQNLQKHVREVHPAAQSEVEVTLTKPSPAQAYYTTATGGQGRQEIVILEPQDGSSPASRNNSMTIMRQVPHPGGQVQVIGDVSSSQGQIIQTSSGQFVQYVQHVPRQSQVRQHQQGQIVEVESGGNYVASSNNNSPDVVVVNSSSPESTKVGEPVVLQAGNNQIVRQVPASGGQQIIRQLTGSRQQVQVISPVQFIQQPGSGGQVVVPSGSQGERVAFLVKQARPTGSLQQQGRSGTHIVSSQPTYVYQSQGPVSGTTARYVYTTATHKTTPTSGTVISQGSDGGESNEYYASPPQLTPQQTIPQRRTMPPGSYTNYSRRTGQSNMRITQTPVGGAPGQKPSTIRYAVQVPPGSTATGQYISGNLPSGSYQYVRTGAPLPAGVRFVTTGGNVVRVPAQTRGGMSATGHPMSQYPVVQVRQQRRAVSVHPGAQGAPRRIRPAGMAQPVASVSGSQPQAMPAQPPMPPSDNPHPDQPRE